jgi:hypothetical protein
LPSATLRVTIGLVGSDPRFSAPYLELNVIPPWALLIALLLKADLYDQGTILIVFCFGLGPFLVLTIAVYLYAKSREDRLAEEAEDEEAEIA